MSTVRVKPYTPLTTFATFTTFATRATFTACPVWAYRCTYSWSTISRRSDDLRICVGVGHGIEVAGAVANLLASLLASLRRGLRQRQPDPPAGPS